MKISALAILLLAVSTATGAPTPSSSLSDDPVAEPSRAEIKGISDQIDELVLQRLSEHGERPNRRVDDATFLRRIYLDAVGRIPTLQEAKRFLNSKAKHKREDLIDDLLGSAGYVSHHFNFWADILRLKSRLNGGNPGLPYIEFVKGSLRENKPYDQFVHEMITAEGAILERGNGATGYYLRDFGMPEDNMANTVRVFLGTRLECAQCHDHPFDKWTQREFFEMVAFTGGMQTRIRPAGVTNAFAMRRKLKNSDASAQVKQTAQRLLRPLTYGVAGGGTGLARLPDSYQYDDGAPNEIVKAKTMFEHISLVEPEVRSESRKPRRPQRRQRQGAPIPGAQDIQSRTAFADWLTANENPRFTQVIANRLWKKVMGLGLVEPVDDLTDDSTPLHPELLAYLTEQMCTLGYDMQQYQRAIFYSKTYQREAEARDWDQLGDYLFRGPLVRRMTAEQMWDSFLALAVENVDEKQGPQRNVANRILPGADIYQGYEELKDMSVEEILQVAEKQVEMRKNPQKRREMQREIMMNAMQDDPNSFFNRNKQMQSRMKKLREAAQRARRNKNFQVLRRLQSQMRDLAVELRHTPTAAPDLVRASELPSPAPPGHFLREFGQSDREQIENANREPAVNQVLSLMNGTIEKRIISNRRTVLMRNLIAAHGVPDKIDVVFLSMLSRYPTQGERRLWIKQGEKYQEESATDLIWTLANSAEYMFVR